MNNYKYIKYKNKYKNYKNQIGGGDREYTPESSLYLLTLPLLPELDKEKKYTQKEIDTFTSTFLTKIREIKERINNEISKLESFDSTEYNLNECKRYLLKYLTKFNTKVLDTTRDAQQITVYFNDYVNTRNTKLSHPSQTNKSLLSRNEVLLKTLNAPYEIKVYTISRFIEQHENEINKCLSMISSSPSNNATTLSHQDEEIKLSLCGILLPQALNLINEGNHDMNKSNSIKTTFDKSIIEIAKRIKKSELNNIFTLMEDTDSIYILIDLFNIKISNITTSAFELSSCFSNYNRSIHENNNVKSSKNSMTEAREKYSKNIQQVYNLFQQCITEVDNLLATSTTSALLKSNLPEILRILNTVIT